MDYLILCKSIGTTTGQGSMNRHWEVACGGFKSRRLAEFTRIRLKDIDLENGTISIRATIRTSHGTLTLRTNQDPESPDHPPERPGGATTGH
ncbi:MAG: hypothetical protein ACP5E3_17100 [Bacteroidales bacterium]